MSSSPLKPAFFGIFDPDGRPWGGTFKNLNIFQTGLESALKIAFLTQRHLIVPAGYFLDNPAIHRIFSKYSGNDKESISFRALCGDLLHISLNESIHDSTQHGVDWNATWDAWVRGTSSKRGQPVHLNCLAPDTAEQLQMLKDVNEFKRKMTSALLQQQGINFQKYLSTLESIRLSTVYQPPFEFDNLIRTRLLTRQELFQDIPDVVFEKLHAAAEAATRSNIRISRSLLNNPILLREIGIPEEQALSRGDYMRIAKVLGHYHHFAFANALGLDAFTTFSIPSPERKSIELLRDSFETISTPRQKGDNAISLSWPLSKISFSNVANARLGKGRTKFVDSLNHLYDHALEFDLEQYNTALYSHARIVTGLISLDFGENSPVQIASDVAQATYTATTNKADSLLSARTILPHFKDFADNIIKELQIRLFFRKLDEA